MIKKQKTVANLSIIILILLIFASAGGLYLDNLYRDNDFLKIVWESTDLLVLFLIVPIFIISLYFIKKSASIRAYLILLGLLDFTLYNYGYYLFAVSFNWFFLLYVALYVLSAITIIIALLNLDSKLIAQRFRTKIPTKLIAGFMIFVSISLTIVYSVMTFGFIFSGNLPVIIERTGHPTNIVFAMDLSLVVPVYAIAGIWLWKRKPWGYVLSTISLVKGALYNLVLSFVTLQIADNGFPESINELPLWLFFTIASFIGGLFLLINLNRTDKNKRI